MNGPPQTHDLMIVFDAVTGGTPGVAALKQAIPDIINFVALAECFERIGVLAYRNYAYTAEKVVEWSGWCYPSRDLSYPSINDILRFVQKLEMPDDSEYKLNCASKTALAKAYQEMRRNGTIILLYNHAPPLLKHIDGDHCNLEHMKIAEYGDTGHIFRNWINGANTLAGSASDKNAVVLSFSLGYHDNLSDWSPYLYLSVATKGELYRTNYTSVSRLTICLLLTWMQADGNIDIPQAFKTTYKNDPTLLHKVCEANMEMFCGPDCGNLQIFNTHTAPRNCLRGGVSNNNQQLNKFTSTDLAKNYINCSEDSKNVIIKHINRIIRTNISVITIHPLFGRLWVAVCMDRTGDKLNKTLTRRFKAQVTQISDAEDKRQAQAWLVGTHAFFREINDEIQMQAEVNLGDSIPAEETERATHIGPAVLVVEEVRRGRALSILHITLYQETVLSDSPWISDKSKKEGRRACHEYFTQWRARPWSAKGFGLSASPPLVDLTKLATNEDLNWKRLHMAIMDVGPMMQYVDFYSPKHKQTPPATWGLWLHMSNNERWTTGALAYITDVAPALIIEGYWLTDLDAPVPKDRFAFDKIFWMPTVSMSLDVKKSLPKEGEEW